MRSAATIWFSTWLARKLQHSTCPRTIPLQYASLKIRLVCLRPIWLRDSFFIGWRLMRCGLFGILWFRGNPWAGFLRNNRCSNLSAHPAPFGLPRRYVAILGQWGEARTLRSDRVSGTAVARRCCRLACQLRPQDDTGLHMGGRRGHAARPIDFFVLDSLGHGG